jgi:hypothetical protein
MDELVWMASALALPSPCYGLEVYCRFRGFSSLGFSSPYHREFLGSLVSLQQFTSHSREGMMW